MQLIGLVVMTTGLHDVLVAGCNVPDIIILLVTDCTAITPFQCQIHVSASEAGAVTMMQ